MLLYKRKEDNMFRYEDEKFKNKIKKYILHPKYQEMKK